MTPGQSIRQIRLDRGLTQWDLVKLTGLTPSTITALENDRRPRARMNTLTRLADALDVSLDQLLGRGAA